MMNKEEVKATCTQFLPQLEIDVSTQVKDTKYRDVKNFYSMVTEHQKDKSVHSGENNTKKYCYWCSSPHELL